MAVFNRFVQTHSIGDCKVVIETILLALTNISNNPGNKKYSVISKSNQTFKWRVVDIPGTGELMDIIGFKDDHEKGAFVWNKSFDIRPSIQVLKNQLNLIQKKIDGIPRKPVQGSSVPISLTMTCEPKASCRFAVGYAESIGRRPTMEDEVVILGMGPRIRENEDYFAIFDGHGGPYVAEQCAKQLHKKFRYSLTLGNNIKESLLTSFSQMDEELKDEKNCGSTGLISFIIDSTLYIANVGDSRAVIGLRGEQAIRLSIDHKPGLQSEKERICRVGGQVQMISGAWRVNGILAVSRAFGDFSLKPYVSAIPYISETSLTPDHLFLVMACDGLWDVLSDDQVVSIVASQSTAHEAAELLRRTAFTRGSDDNISVIVIFLQDHKLWN